MKNEFLKKMEENPIIAAVNEPGGLEEALLSPCKVIFLLVGNIFNLEDIVNRVKGAEKEIYVHLDLMEGFAKDFISLKYIHDHIDPHGFISTRGNLIKMAKEMDIFIIQRLFLLDALSFEKGLKSIHSARPDAVEIMPGIIPKITREVCEYANTPIITGGLIKEKLDVINSLEAGAVGISTSNKDVWYM